MYRSILAVDIEGSTRRNNRAKKSYVTRFTGSSEKLCA